jgi:hypothetical protein
MEKIFSEIYNRYFGIVKRLLSHKGKISVKLMTDTILKYGFGESLLFLLPKLSENRYGLFTEDKGSFASAIPGGIKTPLSGLQKRWIKAVLNDPRASLFLSPEESDKLNETLRDIKPLFHYTDFYYFDRFNDGDDYSDETYRSFFRSILYAIKTGKTLRITYSSRTGRSTKLTILPYHLEYSVKNDCFRLLCLRRTANTLQYAILRLSRIQNLSICDNDTETDITVKSRGKESVILRIYDERNAMERAMLQFADYRKNTRRCDDNSYLCEIFYDKDDETELLIEILSFGPMIQVIENDHFINLIKQRLKKQAELMDK